MGDVFLSRQEQDAIQKLYSTFLTDVRPSKIIPYLFSHQVLNLHDKQNIESEKTDWGQNDRLYEMVLARATYTEVSLMRDALFHSEDPRHIHIASMLPRRETYANPATVALGNSYPPAFNMPGNIHGSPFDPQNLRACPAVSLASPAGGNENNHRQNQASSVGQLVRPDISYNEGCFSTPHQESLHMEDSFNNLSLASQRYSYPGSSQSRDSNFENTQTTYYELPMQNQQNDPSNRRSGLSHATYHSFEEPRQRYHMPELFRQQSVPTRLCPPHTRTEDSPQSASAHASKALGFYKTKTQANGVGRGLCVIIANFTRDLTGYIHDRREITKFFEGTLKYRVLGGTGSNHVKDFENLNRKALIDKLKSVQNHLNDEYSEYDRFVLFILSHGNHNGIKMCADKGGVNEEMHDGKPVTVRPDEIVHMFTHDQVEKLHNMPKCFFLQHCRGRSAVKAAADPLEESGDEGESDNVPPLTAVGSDTAIFYSTCPNYQSFVSDNKGSWFIQNTIKLMREYHDKEHVEDIMSAVNEIISTTHTKEENGKDAHQISQKASSLRKKFYLYIPQHLH